MSIRDDLAQLIADTQCGGTKNPLVSTDFLITDAIIARFGVVELPKPDGITDPDRQYPGLAEWNTELGRVGEFDDGEGFVDMEPLRLMNVSPGNMRELAAALLAAAKRAEARS